MFLTYEILFDAELFVVFEGDAVTSAVFPFWLEIARGNVIDEQDDSLALVAVTVAAVIVVVREEGSNSEAIVNLSSRTNLQRKASFQCIRNV